MTAPEQDQTAQIPQRRHKPYLFWSLSRCVPNGIEAPADPKTRNGLLLSFLPSGVANT